MVVSPLPSTAVYIPGRRGRHTNGNGVYFVVYHNTRVYYTPEVRRGEYWGLGVFLLQYLPLDNNMKMLDHNCIDMNVVE